MVNTANNAEINNTVEITGYSAEGMGVARLLDGCVVFVKGGVRGDVCRLRITKVRKNSRDAEIETLLKPSQHRIKPDCPVFEDCGGCVWRHMTYAEELYAKRERVKDALQRIGGIKIEPEIIRSGKVSAYRNKAQFPVAQKDGKAVAGFYRPGSHEVVGIDACPLVDGSANNALRCVREWINRYDIPVYDGSSGLVRHIYTRTAHSGLIVCIVANSVRIPHAAELIENLRENCENLSGVLLNVNRERGSLVLGERFITLWGSGDLNDRLGDLTVRLSPESFYQVNAETALLLYDKAKEYAALGPGDFLLDLYCGTGTITLYLGRDAKKALGVELSARAVANARENAERNKLRNAEFICADVSLLDTSGLRPDCVTVDPPRKGLSPDVIAKISEMSPPRIVYISCEPSTLARDLKLFESYELQKACVVDMFPRTNSVECVVLLQKKPLL